MITRRQLLRFLLQSGIAMPFVNYSTLNQVLAKDPVLTLGETLPAIEDRIIVVLRLFGGNDGLNTVVPFTDDIYYKMRHEKPVESCAIPEKDVLRINKSSSLGFHPAMVNMRTIFDEDKCVVIQNVGYPNQDLSHFRSTDIWLSGSDTDVFEQTGWLGRYLEQKYSDFTENLPLHPPAIEFSRSVGRLLLGSDYQMGFAYNGLIPVPDKPDEMSISQRGSRKEQDYILSMQKQSRGFLASLTEIEAKSVKNTVEYPISPTNNSVSHDLAHTARLIASGLKTNIYSIVSDNMFDNHERLLLYHNKAITAIDSAVGAFQKDLENLGVADRVLLVIHSEFGRRLAPTGSGTDHGTAGPVFVIGTNVKGGLYGGNPNLQDLDENGNMKFKFDFRQIYATLLSSWFGASATDVFPSIIPHFVDKIPFIKGDSVKSDGLFVFPNPCTTYVTVRIGEETLQSIRIFTMDGRHLNLTYQNYQSFGINIDVGSIPTGTYFVEAVKNNQKHYGSFVKVNQ